MGQNSEMDEVKGSASLMSKECEGDGLKVESLRWREGTTVETWLW